MSCGIAHGPQDVTQQLMKVSERKTAFHELPFDGLFRQKEDRPVKLKVDHQADALYLTLGEKPASGSGSFGDGVSGTAHFIREKS
jgi:hypothetical protein